MKNRDDITTKGLHGQGDILPPPAVGSIRPIRTHTVGLYFAIRPCKYNNLRISNNPTVQNSPSGYPLTIRRRISQHHDREYKFTVVIYNNPTAGRGRHLPQAGYLPSALAHSQHRATIWINENPPAIPPLPDWRVWGTSRSYRGALGWNMMGKWNF